MNRHRLKHRITFVQDIELPPELAGKDLQEFLFAARKQMLNDIGFRLFLEEGATVSEVHTHRLRSVTPGRGIELLIA